MSAPRLVGINHVAIEVGDIEEALAFYGRHLRARLRGRTRGMAFVDMGDQFIALSEGRTQPPDGIATSASSSTTRRAVRAALERAGVQIAPGRGLDFRDPWGNLIQVVQYDEIQFTKTDAVLEAMGLELGKTERALAELRAKGVETN